MRYAIDKIGEDYVLAVNMAIHVIGI